MSAEDYPAVGDPLLGGTIDSPVMAIRESALAHNILTMAQYCTDHGVQLAPHGKTTMSPQLFRAQLKAGAWGIAASTGRHVRAYRRFGLSRVFLANQLVDPLAIQYVASELAADQSFEFICYVDSIAGVRLLERELAATPLRGRRLEVVVEFGAPGGRTGCRTKGEALRIARACAESDHLQLVGAAGYEGVIGMARSPETIRAVEDYCLELRRLAEEMGGAGLLSSRRAPVLSAGGSVFYDVVVNVLSGTEIRGVLAQVLLRSGAYVTHDHGLYHRLSPFELPGSSYRFQPALRLWGRVLSRPEQELVVLDFGRRDAPFDQDLPIPLETRTFDGEGAESAEDFTVTGLNDQHAFVRVPRDRALRPGDWVGCGISHPCTAFDKWRTMPVVDDHDVVVGNIDTYF